MTLFLLLFQNDTKIEVLIMKNIIGERILSLRQNANERQDDLAKVIGCNRATIANYEKGARIPDAMVIAAIATHYGTTTDYLIGLTDCQTINKDVRTCCDFLGVDDTQVLKLKMLIDRNKEHKEYFFKIILSYEFHILLNHIYLSLLYRSKALKKLCSVLEQVEQDVQKSGEELFEIYREGDLIDFSTDISDIEDKIDLNEYKSQKCLIDLINQMCYTLESSKCADFYQMMNYGIIPTTGTLNEIIQDIDCVVDSIKSTINEFIKEQYLMDSD